jgi:dihydropyrimidine dehydrogenase (NAD+) subunit PreT
VRFEWLTQLMAVHGSERAIESVECVAMQIDSQGNVSPVEGSNFRIACDLVIAAIGQSPLLDLLSNVRDLKVERGRVVVDRETEQTTNPRYFAGGDCVNGGREVVDAVAEGKRAGMAIAQQLEGAHVD